MGGKAHRLRILDGGLEAHKGLCVMTEAVLPSSPYDQIALRPSRPTWLEGHLRIIETLLPKIALQTLSRTIRGKSYS
jgi:hypothetical protein